MEREFYSVYRYFVCEETKAGGWYFHGKNYFSSLASQMDGFDALNGGYKSKSGAARLAKRMSRDDIFLRRIKIDVDKTISGYN